MSQTLFLVVPALLGMMALGCASTGEDEGRTKATRAMPNRAELSTWLGEGPTGRAPEFFIQMADTQLGMSEYSYLFMLMDATFHDDQFERDARKFETAVAHVNELKPAFVVICGDLVHRVGHAGQIAEFQRIAATIDPSIPLHLVAGNHDVYGEPTEESLRAYRESFGPDWYAFEHGDVYGIVLNSQLIDAPTQVAGEAARQLAWLRDQLQRNPAAGAKRVIVFQHQPFFLESPDEGNGYFNIEQSSRAAYLTLIKNAGVEAVFAGHLHKNAAGRDGNLEMVTTGPVGKTLGDDPSGFRIIAVEPDALRHEYFSLEQQ